MLAGDLGGTAAAPTLKTFQIVTSGTRPGSPSEGWRIYETDTNLNYQYNGSTWVPFGSKVLQVVNTQTGALATGSGVIPLDDTIPQNTEGDQYMSLAITPVSATSTLLIDVVVFLSPAGVDWVFAALFQDSTAGALAAGAWYISNNTAGEVMEFRHKMTSGTTSATTFKVRAGRANAGVLTFNGSAGGRLLGGVMASSITITEIAP